MSIKRLNHAVLYVTDAKVSAAFYTDVLGFETAHIMGDTAFFLRADGSDNDHDLGLFSVGARIAAPHSVGLYHLAWQVHTLEDLVALVPASCRPVPSWVKATMASARACMRRTPTESSSKSCGRCLAPSGPLTSASDRWTSTLRCSVGQRSTPLISEP